MALRDKFDDETVKEMFEYLDELRESGQTNMFGAAPYVEAAFDLKRSDASVVLQAWMATFDPDKTVAARAAAALEDGAA